ncbi:2105_t:CDS:2 [Paraglomus brasilianum]|uniref:2105_t:CDS:1 n=1 Tax=Paraglomus brasilianum TaxID=144538 RepID=A0A9N9D6B9_9GLOM|nr:2105_t:CDS:2 [Paraglomus brasilianum]
MTMKTLTVIMNEILILKMMISPPISLPSFSPLISPQHIASQNQPSTTTVDSQAIRHNMDECDSSDDNEYIIDQYSTGHFIQDAMMHRPWKIFPPAQECGIYKSEMRMKSIKAIFEEWPEKIRQYDEQFILGDNEAATERPEEGESTQQQRQQSVHKLAREQVEQNVTLIRNVMLKRGRSRN